MRKTLFFLLTLSTLIWAKNVQSQCPSLSISASEVCSVYGGICGCQTSYVDITGNLPGGYVVTNTQLTLNGLLFPTGQTNAPAFDPVTMPAFYGTFPNYVLHNYSIASGPYVLQLTMSNGSNTLVCQYPFSVPINNTAASPFFITHYKTVAQLEAMQTAPATIFYQYEPISFDGTGSNGTYEYTLACTRVNQNGVAIGSTVYAPDPYYSPDVPLSDFGFQNLRYLFSNLVDPSGMEYNRYYRIDMVGTGCNDQGVTTSRIIRISQGARQIKTRSAEFEMPDEIYPNPGNGMLTLNLNEEQEELVVRVYDVEGQVAFEQTLNDFTSGTLDMSSLRDGIYMLHFESKNLTKVEKIIIAH